jgi:hypothetical protein
LYKLARRPGAAPGKEILEISLHKLVRGIPVESRLKKSARSPQCYRHRSDPVTGIASTLLVLHKGTFISLFLLERHDPERSSGKTLTADNANSFARVKIETVFANGPYNKERTPLELLGAELQPQVFHDGRFGV